MFQYTGHLHIHSKYSDGNATIAEIGEAANKAGLDFAIITDHNCLKGRYQKEEGWYNKTLILAEAELDTQGKNHYLALGLEEVPHVLNDPAQMVEAVYQAGGFGFLAHPCEKGSPIVLNGASFPWQNWNIKGFTGLEIWNHCSRWRDDTPNVPVGLYRLLRNKIIPYGVPCQETIKKWDYFLSQGEKIFAVAGSDAHAIKARIGPIKTIIFPYEYLFKGVNIHILLPDPLDKEDFNTARQQIYDALKKGRFYIGFDLLKDATGFRCLIQDGEKEYQQGQDVPLRDSTSLMINAPVRRSEIRIIHDGKQVFKTRSSTLAFKILKPGTFRVEVHHRPRLGRLRPWIYSNPFFVALY